MTSFFRPVVFLLLALAPFTLSSCIGAKIRNLKNEIFIQEARITSLKQDLAACRENADEQAGENARLRADLEKQNARVNQLEEELKETETNLAAAKLTLSTSLDSQSKEIQERLVESVEETQRYKLTIEGLESKVSSMETELMVAQQERKELEEKLAASNSKLESSREAAGELSAEIDTLKSQMSELEANHQSTVNQITDDKLKAQEQLKASEEKVNSLNSEIRFLNDKLDLANKDKSELEEKFSSLEAELTKNQQVAAAKEENPDTPTEDVSTALELAKEKLQTVIASKRGQLTAKGNRLEIILFSDDLFDRGTTLLTDHGLRALQKIDEIIQASPNKMIIVEGHTDSTPVRNMPYPDNWELAAARATEVVRWLASQPGTEGKDIVAQSRSFYDPISTNNTAEGRRMNRRVQIVLEF